MGLASVYSSEGKMEEALRALSRAVELDPKRADLHAARARALRTEGDRIEARMEFQNALTLDPTSAEAKAGLISLRGEPRHELRFTEDNDLFNFTGANHGGWVSLASQWMPRWGTNFAGSFYERAGIRAGKFSGAITARSHLWGALTAGGAAGHDNGVIPKSEAFFDVDHGWKTGEKQFCAFRRIFVRAALVLYRQSRILTLSGTAIVYLPREWTVSLGATGARSAFSGTGAEWRPSGMTRLGFPLRIGARGGCPEMYFSPPAPKISHKSTRSGDSLRKRMAADAHPDKRPSGRHRLCLVSEAHPKQN